MIKEILIQYCDLKQETKDLRKRIEDLEIKIQRIEEESSVIDVVKGGCGGIQNFVVEGFPYPEYSKKKTLLCARRQHLNYLEFELMVMLNAVDDYIGAIKDSRIRMILRYRYIDDLNWVQVAHKMGGGNTEDSVKKAHERFLIK